MSESMKEDLKDHRVPNCIYWTVEDVCTWIEGIGFPDYKVGVISLLSQPKFCARIHLLVFKVTGPLGSTKGTMYKALFVRW